MTAVSKSNLGKVVSAAAYCVRHPAFAASALRRGLTGIYQHTVSISSPLPEVTLAELVPTDTELTLGDFHSRNGNVSLFELTVIASLVSHRKPNVLLEIGTFDGNTTLQMARNAPADAIVFTLDLPPDPAAAAGQLDAADVAYIVDEQKLDRRYAHATAGRKVVQCLGDSATFDFSEIASRGKPELVFIDGSHSYDYVRNDTEKILEIAAPNAVILWHDYVPAWPGVIDYLGELRARLPLQRIKGTSLVYLDLASSRGWDR